MRSVLIEADRVVEKTKSLEEGGRVILENGALIVRDEEFTPEDLRFKESGSREQVRRKLHVRDTRCQARLDLRKIDFEETVEFEHCTFDKGLLLGNENSTRQWSWGAKFKKSLTFLGCRFGGLFDISGIEVAGELRFEDCTFEGSDLRGVTASKGWSIKRCKFVDRVVLEHEGARNPLQIGSGGKAGLTWEETEIRGGLEISRCHPDQEELPFSIGFNEVTVGGPLRLRNVTLTKPLTIVRCELGALQLGNQHRESSQACASTTEIEITSCTIKHEVDLDGLQVAGGSVVFKEVKVGGGLWMRKAKFGRGTHFMLREVEVGGKLLADGSEWPQRGGGADAPRFPVEFNQLVCRGLVSLSDLKAEGPVRWIRSVFGGTLEVRRSQFRDLCEFGEGAYERRRADMDPDELLGSEFKGRVLFSKTTFAKADFSECVFHQATSFREVIFEVGEHDFANVKAKSTFRLKKVRLLKDDAGKMATLDFQPTTKQGRAGTIFEGEFLLENVLHEPLSEKEGESESESGAKETAAPPLLPPSGATGVSSKGEDSPVEIPLEVRALTGKVLFADVEFLGGATIEGILHHLNLNRAKLGVGSRLDLTHIGRALAEEATLEGVAVQLPHTTRGSLVLDAREATLRDVEITYREPPIGRLNLGGARLDRVYLEGTSAFEGVDKSAFSIDLSNAQGGDLAGESLRLLRVEAEDLNLEGATLGRVELSKSRFGTLQLQRTHAKFLRTQQVICRDVKLRGTLPEKLLVLWSETVVERASGLLRQRFGLALEKSEDDQFAVPELVASSKGLGRLDWVRLRRTHQKSDVRAATKQKEPESAPIDTIKISVYGGEDAELRQAEDLADEIYKSLRLRGDRWSRLEDVEWIESDLGGSAPASRLNEETKDTALEDGLRPQFGKLLCKGGTLRGGLLSGVEFGGEVDFKEGVHFDANSSQFDKTLFSKETVFERTEFESSLSFNGCTFLNRLFVSEFVTHHRGTDSEARPPVGIGVSFSGCRFLPEHGRESLRVVAAAVGSVVLDNGTTIKGPAVFSGGAYGGERHLELRGVSCWAPVRVLGEWGRVVLGERKTGDSRWVHVRVASSFDLEGAEIEALVLDDFTCEGSFRIRGGILRSEITASNKTVFEGTLEVFAPTIGDKIELNGAQCGSIAIEEVKGAGSSPPNLLLKGQCLCEGRFTLRSGAFKTIELSRSSFKGDVFLTPNQAALIRVKSVRAHEDVSFEDVTFRPVVEAGGVTGETGLNLKGVEVDGDLSFVELTVTGEAPRFSLFNVTCGGRLTYTPPSLDSKPTHPPMHHWERVNAESYSTSAEVGDFEAGKLQAKELAKHWASINQILEKQWEIAASREAYRRHMEGLGRLPLRVLGDINEEKRSRAPSLWGALKRVNIFGSWLFHRHKTRPIRLFLWAALVSLVFSGVYTLDETLSVQDALFAGMLDGMVSPVTVFLFNLDSIFGSVFGANVFVAAFHLQALILGLIYGRLLYMVFPTFKSDAHVLEFTRGLSKLGRSPRP